jgi:fructoselysine-6-P-deglycase FrlB-like protein
MPIDPSSTRMHTEAFSTAELLHSPIVRGQQVPMLRIQSFYRMANALSVRLGRDPDRPPYVNKVTSSL